MFPYSFTAKIVLPTPDSSEPSPTQQLPPPPYYELANTESSLQSQRRPNFQTRDTLNDLDEAITEISGSNQQPSRTRSHPHAPSSPVPDTLNWQPEDVKNYFLSLGYDPEVCDCFLRHHITGSILLELDLAYLKEIDISSFGTRFQISKEIKKLNQAISPDGQNNRSHMDLSTEDAQTRFDSRNEKKNLNVSNNDDFYGNVSRDTDKQESGAYNNINRPNYNSDDTKHAHVSPSGQQSLLRSAKQNSTLSPEPPQISYKESQQGYNRDVKELPHSSSPLQFKNLEKELLRDRSSTVSNIQRSSETARQSSHSNQAKQKRVRSTTITTTDQYFHENHSSSDSIVVDTDNTKSLNFQQDSHLQKTDSRHHSYSNTQKNVFDTHHGTTDNMNHIGGPAETFSSEPNQNPSHKKSGSTSNKGFFDFKYLGKSGSGEESSSDSNTSLNKQRRSSLDSVMLPSEKNRSSKKKGRGKNSKEKNDLEQETEENSARRVMTNSSSSSHSSGSDNNRSSSRDRSPSQSENSEGKKKVLLRSSTSQVNLRKGLPKKAQTSAFQEGINTITPTEAAKTADYSGWMNKRGSVAIGTWKTRFFTLHGTRLSYFSQFSDTREKGLIDITSHKVVPVADDDKFVAMYAASVGAGRHCFKIVPPPPGSRKGVTFTVPKIHYFATDTKEEMREWINAITKATIDRDDSVPVFSSCSTPTVSLVRAQEIMSESKIKGDELRAKMMADNSSNNSQTMGGFGSTGNNSVAAASPNLDESKSIADASKNTFLSAVNAINAFDSGFQQSNNDSQSGNSVSPPSTGLIGNATENMSNGTPLTPESGSHSVSSKSFDPNSLLSKGSFAATNKQFANSTGSGGFGSPNQGFGPSPVGIRPATHDINRGFSHTLMNNNNNGRTNTGYHGTLLPAAAVTAHAGGTQSNENEIEDLGQDAERLRLVTN